MPITINGNGTISGLSAGGLPNGSVTNDTLATTARPLFRSLAIIEHYEAHGTNGQAISTADTWVDKTLTRIYTDPDSIVSLSSNQFTLQAGTYYINWGSTFFEVDRCQTRLYNVTDSAVVKHSQNGFAQNSSAYATIQPEGDARITIVSAKTFKLQAYIDNVAVSANAELGISGSTNANNDGSEELFARVIIYKENT
jgi:hypothetical protein